MAEIVVAEDFLKRYKEGNALLLDVRSESEFNQGHISGAVNLPLLNDEHRIIVGTLYKQNGREAAVLSGFDLAGNKFGDFIRTSHELSPDKNVMLYCWRGGMRSNIMAWILNTAGFKVTLLKGGYKYFRRWAADQFTRKHKIVIIGGRTGSGKTDVLKCLKEKGEQVIDLEALANHKGSAFGSMGELPQPRNEYFENLLAMEWSNIDPSKILWLENESINIGSVKIPNTIFDMMRAAQVVELTPGVEARSVRILEVYGKYSVEALIENTVKLKKRLGDLRTRLAVEALQNNNKEGWLEEVLAYYDSAYDYGMSQRKPNNSIKVEWGDHESIDEVVNKILFVFYNEDMKVKKIK